MHRTRATRSAVLVLVAVAALAASPQALPAAAAPAPPVEPAVAQAASIEVGAVSVIVNRDGSATIGAEITNGTDAEAALADVRVEKGDRALPVSATPFWLPLLPGSSARVGDASDAGGFVVPQGVDVGDALTLRFLLDTGTCLDVETDAVARSSEHSLVYPKDGTRLGPATVRPAC